jgi:hypothetical protein
MSHAETQLCKHSKERIEEYRFKFECISHQCQFGQTYKGKNITELKADLYKEYCNEVFYNSRGFYKPISYTSFFILLGDPQGHFA